MSAELQIRAPWRVVGREIHDADGTFVVSAHDHEGTGGPPHAEARLAAIVAAVNTMHAGARTPSSELRQRRAEFAISAGRSSTPVEVDRYEFWRAAAKAAKAAGLYSRKTGDGDIAGMLARAWRRHCDAAKVLGVAP